MSFCSVSNCGRSSSRASSGRKGLCRSHYRRLRIYGDPLDGPTMTGDPLRFYLEEVLVYEGDECLIWPFNRDSYGYGRIKKDGKSRIVSRILCEEANGSPPTLDHQAAHSCGKGHLGCVTKRHVSWKTQTENMADKAKHGTLVVGETNKQSKLTECQVREIFGLKGSISQDEIGRRFGVSQTTVSRIHDGSRWRHLTLVEAA